MKIFSSELTKQADAYTIKNEPISSINLMERAASRACDKIVKLYYDKINFAIFAGPGNNGGDGLVIARLLIEKGLNATVYFVKFTDKTSEDFKINLQRLQKLKAASFIELKHAEDFPKLTKNELIIDAIFGSGLSRVLNGLAEKIVKKINELPNEVLAIDCPSGLFGENNPLTERTVIEADNTLTFQYPSLSFMCADNEKYVGKFHITDIGLHKDFIEKTQSDFYYTQSEDIKIAKRKRFSHKGNYGHALLLAGSYGKAGACVLAAKAAHRAGIGLLTSVVPACNFQILQISSPETMLFINENEKSIAQLPDLSLYNAIAVGPGIGFAEETKQVLSDLIASYEKPIVFDADAITILSQEKELLKNIPENSILTPHPKEFERLVGKSSNNFEELQKQINFSKTYKVYLVLKGANSSVSCPDGKVHFNSTGNPGMATGGSGDVLTGIIVSFLAQGYTPKDAAIYGTFLHGLAGDYAAEKKGEYPLIASDIISSLPDALKGM